MTNHVIYVAPEQVTILREAAQKVTQTFKTLTDYRVALQEYRRCDDKTHACLFENFKKVYAQIDIDFISKNKNAKAEDSVTLLCTDFRIVIPGFIFSTYLSVSRNTTPDRKELKKMFNRLFVLNHSGFDGEFDPKAAIVRVVNKWVDLEKGINILDAAVPMGTQHCFTEHSFRQIEAPMRVELGHNFKDRKKFDQIAPQNRASKVTRAALEESEKVLDLSPAQLGCFTTYLTGIRASKIEVFKSYLQWSKANGRQNKFTPLVGVGTSLMKEWLFTVLFITNNVNETKIMTQLMRGAKEFDDLKFIFEQLKADSTQNQRKGWSASSNAAKREVAFKLLSQKALDTSKVHNSKAIKKDKTVYSAYL
jgi:hypothetical protein